MIDRIDAALRQVRQSARTRSMYPHGHPSRAAAGDVARNVLMHLFRSVDRVDLVISPHGFACEGEELPDEDGSLRRMASFLRSQRIGCITIQRGLTDEEADLLLDLVAAATGAEDHRDIAERLIRTEAEFLRVTEIDYESFVPASEAGAQSSEPPSPENETGRGLAAADGVVLLELLEEPSELTRALLSSAAALANEEGGELSGVIGAMLSGEGDAEDTPTAAADELGMLQAAGAALARAVQRLAERACNAQPDNRDGVFAQLACALRQLKPQLLAFVFRTALEPDAPFDSLTETGRHLTMEEAVEIVCAPLGEIDAEPPEVYEKLLERLASTPALRAELSAKLKEALTERGLSAEGLMTVLEAALEPVSPLEASVNEAIAASSVPPMAEASLEIRADRRALLANRLQSASQSESQARRAAACAELLVLPQLPGRFSALLADLRESLSGVADDHRPGLEMAALKALGEAAQPSSHLSAECAAEAFSLIDDIASPQAVDRMCRSLEGALDADRLRIIRALSVVRQGGNAAVSGLLLNGHSVRGEEEAAAIAVILADAEEAGVTGQVGLSELIANPACRHAPSVIRALAERGGRLAPKHLSAALTHGEYAVRRAVVDAAGEADTPIVPVLLLALQDREEDISAAAARYLAASGDPQGRQHLLQALQAGSPLRPCFGRRTAAAAALGELKYEPAADALVRILRRPSFTRRTSNDELRAVAARALVELGTRPALEAVAARQHGERSPEIRELAGVVAERLADDEFQADHAEEDVPDAN